MIRVLAVLAVLATGAAILGVGQNDFLGCVMHR
jgi:hypothetical protein